jgi:hypothetical protein
LDTRLLTDLGCQYARAEQALGRGVLAGALACALRKRLAAAQHDPNAGPVDAGIVSTGTVFDGELSKVLDGRGYGRFREAT